MLRSTDIAMYYTVKSSVQNLDRFIHLFYHLSRNQIHRCSHELHHCYHFHSHYYVQNHCHLCILSRKHNACIVNLHNHTRNLYGHLHRSSHPSEA